MFTGEGKILTKYNTILSDKVVNAATRKHCTDVNLQRKSGSHSNLTLFSLGRPLVHKGMSSHSAQPQGNGKGILLRGLAANKQLRCYKFK